MSSVTSCYICDGPLEGKYANALTCSSRCRQKAHRLRAKGEAPRRCNADADPSPKTDQRHSWKALRKQEGLTDEKLRRVLTDRVVRARIAQSRVSEEDRRLFADDPGRVAA
jgi:hypothetical protein